MAAPAAEPRQPLIDGVGVYRPRRPRASPLYWLIDRHFRPDGTFARGPGWPGPDTAHLTEAFRRAVLRLFVRRGLFDAEQAQGMLHWPHSGFHVHAGVGVPED